MRPLFCWWCSLCIIPLHCASRRHRSMHTHCSCSIADCPDPMTIHPQLTKTRRCLATVQTDKEPRSVTAAAASTVGFATHFIMGGWFRGRRNSLSLFNPSSMHLLFIFYSSSTYLLSSKVCTEVAFEQHDTGYRSRVTEGPQVSLYVFLNNDQAQSIYKIAH